MGDGEAEERREGGRWGSPAIEPEHELVQVALEMRRPQAVVDAERPTFGIGEHRWIHGSSTCAAIGPTTFGSCLTSFSRA